MNFALLEKYKKIFEERKKWSTSVNVDLQYMGDSVCKKILNVCFKNCLKFNCQKFSVVSGYIQLSFIFMALMKKFK